MRLAPFIRGNTDQIVGEWEMFAQTLIPSSGNTGSATLRDHIHQILTFVVSDMGSLQTGSEQIEKSRGNKTKISQTSAAEAHASLRLTGGFDLNQMVSEYRALRASIVKLWVAENVELTNEDILDLIRFDESIDQQLTESISYYTNTTSHSKDLFLGILSHDLRTPISAALMSAQLVPKIGPLNERQNMLCLQIVECTSRASEIVVHLFDLTRARFGSGLPVVREPMNMEFISRQLVGEMQVIYPDRMIVLTISGDLEGQWDKTRIGQVLSNLIGNAAQYGFKDLPINVNVTGSTTEVVLSVHNDGIPIPAKKIGRIFESLTRGGEDDNEEQTNESHLGLGLYITKEIVISHGGTIDVHSTEKEGTMFTAHFPRVLQDDCPDLSNATDLPPAN